jgi:hypothetical protein
MRRLIGLFCCLLGLAFACAAPAVAQQAETVAPPGASAVDEYLETVPGADGNRPVKPGGAGHALTAKQRHALEQLGEDGRLAVALADATAPARRAGAKSGGGSSRDVMPSAPSARGDSPIAGTLTRALGGSGGGVGAALPAFLAVTLVAAGAFALRRRSVA